MFVKQNLFLCYDKLVIWDTLVQYGKIFLFSHILLFFTSLEILRIFLIFYIFYATSNGQLNSKATFNLTFSANVNRTVYGCAKYTIHHKAIMLMTGMAYYIKIYPHKNTQRLCKNGRLSQIFT